MHPKAVVSLEMLDLIPRIGDILTAHGWKCAHAGHVGRAFDATALGTAAFFGTLEDLGAMKRLRHASDGDAIAIIIATGTNEPSPKLGENLIDSKISSPFTDETVAALARRWYPHPLSSATRRIADELGSDAVGALLDRFRATLAAALEEPGRLEDRGLAHRIGGIAGTLGFAALGDLYKRVSTGTPPPLSTLRHESRTTLITIHRARTAGLI